MHLLAHSLSAIPFLLAGSPLGALGAVAADVTWIYPEIKYRVYRANGGGCWHEWAEKNVTPLLAMPYRLAHSALLVIPFCLVTKQYEFLAGWCVHVAMDLPTHTGVMQQRPLYPFKWKWKWVIKK